MTFDALNAPWNGQLTTPVVAVIICSGISLYNALELLLLIFLAFKKWSGLYFWSLLTTSVAVVAYSAGFLVEYFNHRHVIAGDVINNIGWIFMVTGQSVVLYSRLHLILHDQRVLRFVACMIATNAVVFYVSTSVIHYGTYSNLATFHSAFKVIEKTQMTAFCIQEFIISGLYMREVLRFLKIATQEGTRRTLGELFLVNLIIILLDIGLLVMEYMSLSVFEQTFKGVTYSVKLKMELAILGKLVSMAQSGNQIVFGHGTVSVIDENMLERSNSNATTSYTKSAVLFQIRLQITKATHA